MKILSLLLLTFFTLNFTTNKIAVKVCFENKSNIYFEKGTLTIKETGEEFEVTSQKNFEIILESGKYNFNFVSNTDASVIYPKKIDLNNRTVRIVLNKKIDYDNQNIASSENVEKLVKSGKAKFISFGIAMQDFKEFREKYDIDVKTEGCVITTERSKIATENNLLIANYLTKIYGDSWKKDLPFLPYGLENFN